MIRKRCRTQDDFYDQEFSKGEIAGIRFALAMPKLILEVDGDIKRAEIGQEDEDAK